MKIIICGAGQVGSGIARQLAVENNDVTVIDQSPELVQSLQEQIDVRGIVGHGAHPDVLDRAGASEADMIIAVTFYDEVNMIAAQIAHSLFRVPLKIARVRAQSYLNPMWQDLFSRDHMPIDVIISPELEVGRSVLRRLEVPGAFESASFADGLVQVVGVRIEQDTPIVDTPLEQLTELFPDLQAVVVGIVRHGALFIPTRRDQMLIGDEVYFVSAREHVARTLDLFGHQEPAARRVIVVGGGNIGIFVAKELEERPGVRVKLIEADKKRAEKAADALARTVVFNGSGLDQAILREAGIQDAESIVALTNDDKVNILSAVIGKQLGCKKSMTLINHPDFGAVVPSLGIDTFLDPRATTVSTILQHVRRGRIRRVHSVRGGAAEVIEAEALETSPLVGKPLRETDLPDGALVGGVVRAGRVVVPRGDTVIEAGDRVILFVEKSVVPKVERLVRVGIEYF